MVVAVAKTYVGNRLAFPDISASQPAVESRLVFASFDLVSHVGRKLERPGDPVATS